MKHLRKKLHTSCYATKPMVVVKERGLVRNAWETVAKEFFGKR